MKVVFASLVALVVAEDFDVDGHKFETDWAEYKKFFQKVYNAEAGSGSEQHHKVTFVQTMKAIHKQNALGESLKFGPNQFSDMNQAEYREAAGLGRLTLLDEDSLPLFQGAVQEAVTAGYVDWEAKGAVTPVKDQGQCGSCWSFSTTGGLEGAWQIATTNLVSMAEEQFVQCSKRNAGCNGGNVGQAFKYAETVGIVQEAGYKYTAADGTCNIPATAQIAIPQGSVTGYTSIGTHIFRGPNANDMKSALQNGPVSIAIQADQSSFQRYSSGILMSGCGTSLDHAVLNVGYGVEGSNEYWRVKNSWATTWGDEGYIRLSTTGNVCGLLSNQAVYPRVSASVAV